MSVACPFFVLFTFPDIQVGTEKPVAVRKLSEGSIKKRFAHTPRIATKRRGSLDIVTEKVIALLSEQRLRSASKLSVIEDSAVSDEESVEWKRVGKKPGEVISEVDRTCKMKETEGPRVQDVLSNPLSEMGETKSTGPGVDDNDDEEDDEANRSGTSLRDDQTIHSAYYNIPERRRAPSYRPAIMSDSDSVPSPTGSVSDELSLVSSSDVHLGPRYEDKFNNNEGEDRLRRAGAKYFGKKTHRTTSETYVPEITLSPPQSAPPFSLSLSDSASQQFFPPSGAKEKTRRITYDVAMGIISLDAHKVLVADHVLQRPAVVVKEKMRDRSHSGWYPEQLY